VLSKQARAGGVPEVIQGPRNAAIETLNGKQPPNNSSALIAGYEVKMMFAKQVSYANIDTKRSCLYTLWHQWPFAAPVSIETGLPSKLTWVRPEQIGGDLG